MSNHIGDILDIYDEIENRTDSDNPIAAALLTLCVIAERYRPIVKDFTDNLDHFICLGIRYGLFGTGASEMTSINAIAEKLEEIAEALQDLEMPKP